jgi:hypothetical protein
MDNKFVLWDGLDQKMLPAGIHKLNFVFPLPYTCPPSYEGKKCRLLGATYTIGGDPREKIFKIFSENGLYRGKNMRGVRM